MIPQQLKAIGRSAPLDTPAWQPPMLRPISCCGNPRQQLDKVWLELSLTAADLITWAQALCCTGALAHCEPATFCYRMCSVASRLTRHGRTWRLHLDRDWPWAGHLATAFARLRAAPGPPEQPHPSLPPEQRRNTPRPRRENTHARPPDRPLPAPSKIGNGSAHRLVNDRG